MAIGFILQSGELPGGPELLIILLIALLLVGGNKIQKLAGEAIDEFEKGRKEVEQELGGNDSSSNPDPSSTEPSNSKSTTTPREETKVFDSGDEDESGDTRVFDSDD